MLNHNSCTAKRTTEETVRCAQLAAPLLSIEMHTYCCAERSTLFSAAPALLLVHVNQADALTLSVPRNRA